MIAQADAVKIPLSDKSVHCVMTSPPYWGLRKYAGEQGRMWGGDPACEHDWVEHIQPPKGGRNLPDNMPNTGGNKTQQLVDNPRFGVTTEFCQLCGAWYGSLGLEPTPEQHVQNMVEVFREVKRVLRDDGVVWLNYGDCYGHGTEARRPSGNTRGISDKTSDAQNINRHGGTAGNLMMMPHRVALALQADGWIVRQDLVWYKRNPMPESVNGWRWQRERARDPEWKEKRYGGKGEDPQSRTERLKMNVASARAAGIDHETGAVGVGWEYGDDLELKRGSWRHTRAHEYVFMLTKKMQYFSNQEAVREGNSEGSIDRFKNANPGWEWNTERDGRPQPGPYQGGGRNPRSVLDVPTAPYKGAHYATFPPNLIAPLIRATCPRRCCPVCGQGWAAVVDKASVGTWHDHTENLTHGARQNSGGPKADFERGQVLGYRPTCKCEHDEEPVPGICFDPFVGSGTTVKVAQDLLRKGIGIDISMEYLDLQAKVRIGQGSPSNVLDDLPLFQ